MSYSPFTRFIFRSRVVISEYIIISLQHITATAYYLHSRKCVGPFAHHPPRRGCALMLDSSDPPPSRVIAGFVCFTDNLFIISSDAETIIIITIRKKSKRWRMGWTGANGIVVVECDISPEHFGYAGTRCEKCRKTSIITDCSEYAESARVASTCAVREETRNFGVTEDNIYIIIY